MIDSWDMFNETLHVNDDVDRASDELYPKIKACKRGLIATDLPPGLNMERVIITKGYKRAAGAMGISSSRQLKNGKWEIRIYLSDDFTLDTLKHELSHGFRLTKIGKEKALNNISHLKSELLFKPLNSKAIENFFLILYLANDEEISVSSAEVKGFIRELTDMSAQKIGMEGRQKPTKDSFIYALKNSDPYFKYKRIENFDIKENFKDFTTAETNKFFYLLEQNASQLDKIRSGYFPNFRLVLKSIKQVFFNNVSLGGYSPKPKRGIEFYDKWIKKQANKYKRRLYSLYDHFN